MLGNYSAIFNLEKYHELKVNPTYKGDEDKKKKKKRGLGIGI